MGCVRDPDGRAGAGTRHGPALPTFEEAVGEDLVVARLEGVDVLLPVPREVSTAVAYHSVDNANTVPFSPRGDRLSGGGLGQSLGDIFAGGGAIQYYLMDGNGGDVSSSTSGLDIGAVPGSAVTSPVNGKVVAIKKYSILGRYDDVEIDLQVADDPSLLMMITHVVQPKVEIGDVVRRATPRSAWFAGFP